MTQETRELVDAIKGLLSCMEQSAEFSDGTCPEMLRAYQAIAKAEGRE